MFKIDDCVSYGVNGVCRIVDICPSPFDKNDTRDFYVLKPLFMAATANATIYSPIGIENRKLRPLIAKEEAEEILRTAKDLGFVEISMEKNRRHIYQETMASGDPREYIRILKTVERRRKEASELRKQLPDVDVEYEAKARRCLFGEIATVLGIPFDDVGTMI